MRLAQLDRAFGYGPKGRGFESHPGRFRKEFNLIVIFGILAQLGEHLPYKQRVTGSSPTRGVWLLGQVVKTPPFHGGNMGSNPVGVI